MKASLLLYLIHILLYPPNVITLHYTTHGGTNPMTTLTHIVIKIQIQIIKVSLINYQCLPSGFPVANIEDELLEF